MKKVEKMMVAVNGKKISLDARDKVTVLDALIKAGYKRETLMPKDTKGVAIIYNGEQRAIFRDESSMVRVSLNGEVTSLLSEIKSEDIIVVNEVIEQNNNDYRLSMMPDYNTNIIYDIDGKKCEIMRLLEVNNEVTFGDAIVKNGDDVKAYDYYTLRQIKEAIDLDDDLVVMQDGEELSDDSIVYSNAMIETYVKVNNDKEFEPVLIRHEDMLVGDDYMYSEDNMPTVSQVDEVEEISVILNGEQVHLNSKSYYAVIDALDAANVDAMEAAGKNIVITVNSEKASFSTQITDKDEVVFVYN